MPNNDIRGLFKKYSIFIIYCIFFLILAFALDTPYNIFQGIKKIIIDPDILLTDYIALSGLSAALVNVALVSLLSVFIIIMLGIKPSGVIISALITTSGFSFFGKNIFNIWPIIIGVFLYSRYKKEPFSNYITIALFGTSLSPTVGQIKFFPNVNYLVALFSGFLLGIFIGFIFPPITKYCLKLHKGYNLYNTGFAAGLISTMIMAILRSFGINFEKRLILSGNNNILSLIFYICFFSLILIGFIYTKKEKIPISNLFKLYKESGKIPSDFYTKYGEGITLINMGVLGVLFISYVLLIGGDINGPSIGGILTIVAFGSYGKHLKNVTPIIIGTILSSIFTIWNLNSYSMILTTLFSTTLAPIAGTFGPLYGILAGILHVSLSMNVGYLHGGLNLYNNGFAGGLVVITLLPLIESLDKKFKK